MKYSYVMLVGLSLAGCSSQKESDPEFEAMMQGLMALQRAMHKHNQVKEQRDRDNRAALHMQSESHRFMQQQHDFMNQQMLQQQQVLQQQIQNQMIHQQFQTQMIHQQQMHNNF